MRDQSAAAALSERHTHRQRHDGVMIDVSSRRPPDSFAAARAAHGELESEDVPRSWPSARPTASKTERRRGSHRGVRMLAVW